MKRLFVLLAATALAGAMWAQQVFTVAFATSDDGFVNVREAPSTKARILTKLWMFSHGLGSGILEGTSGKWSRVSVGNITGWAYSKYVGTQNWYDGNGAPRLVATKERTTVYSEDFSDSGEMPVFGYVPKGTILADRFGEDDTYYILFTAHDNLFIRKEDAKVVK